MAGSGAREDCHPGQRLALRPRSRRPASRDGGRARPCRGGGRRGGGRRGRCAALEPEPGEESRARRAGAGRPGFRKRRAVVEVSGAWALGAGIPGGPAQPRSPRAPGDVSEAPEVPARGSGGRRGVPPAPATPLGALGPATPQLWASVLSPVKWARRGPWGSWVCRTEIPGSPRSKPRNQKLGAPAAHLGGIPILGG